MQRARSHVVLVLCICAASGCNLVLGNDKRSLTGTTDAAPPVEAGPTSPPPPQREDATPPADSGADMGSGGVVPDAGPTMSVDSGSDTGPRPAACASPDQVSECAPGTLDTEMQPCGLCMRGKQYRTRTCGDTCGWGAYSDWGMCQEDAEACQPGKPQERVARCGPCNTGRLISRRTCTDSCRWSDWSAEACELDPLYCMPGATKARPDVPCGQRCGVIKQTQTCGATCTWDAPVMSACMEAGVCTPGAMQAAPNAACNAEYCMKGVQQQISVCTSMCAWGTPISTGTCTIPTGVCRPADLGGMGYRCRPNDPGYREVCSPSTASAANRCMLGPREPFAGCQ